MLENIIKGMDMPKFKFVLFDADGTLFDHDMAEGTDLQ